MNDYNIKDLNLLPSIEEIIKFSKGFALLDAIIMPNWEYRYFSFNSNWDLNKKEKMASMRDGSGNEYSLHFSEFGIVGKSFLKNNSLDSKIFLKNIPNEFYSFKSEVAFNLNNVTFFFWKKIEDKIWQSSPNDLKTFPLLSFLVGGLNFYHNWAENYYEKDININVLREVFNSLSVNEEQLKILNPEITFKILSEDFLEITGKSIK